MGIPTIGQTGELLPLPPLASIWKDLRLLGILFRIKSGTHKVIEKLSQEKVSQQEALEKFKWKVVRDHEIKEEDTKEEAFEEFSLTLDNVLEKLSQENESPDDFYGLMYDTDDDASINGKSYFFVGLDHPIHVVVAQKNVHEEVAKEVIEMANDQAEALSSDKEVTDECLDDEHVEERRPSKRIRVTQEEMVTDKKPKKG
ncbi:hypothetical protein Tco_1143800 [Tanacetum coccineum]